MKTKITIAITALLLVVSFGLAQSGTSSPNPPDSLKGVQAQLQIIQTELQQVTARVATMDTKLRTLEQANADLNRQVQTLIKRVPVPLNSK